MQNALRPDGHLVVLFNTSKPMTVDAQVHDDYAKSVLSELKRAGIPLPDDEAVLYARLSAHSWQRQKREGSFTNPDDVQALLKTAGMDVISCDPVGVKLASAAHAYVSYISKRRFMAVAKRAKG